MQNDFWHQAWAKSDRPGWQQKEVNPYLVEHWAASAEKTPTVVFVPLCGRSLDMLWLREQGHHVVGIDLSVAALEQFCEQQSIEVAREQEGALTVFRSDGWTLYGGDFFTLSHDHMRHVDRVYDRAALIALPPALREKYAAHTMSILPSAAEIFAITITYDQSKMNGPPFSVPDEELHALFGDQYQISIVQSQSDPDQVGNLGARGLDTLREACLVLKPKVSLET